MSKAVNGGNFYLDPRNRIWIPVKVVTGNDDWVVPEASAKGFYGDTDWFNVDRSHIKLVKPSGTADVVYQHTATFLAKVHQVEAAGSAYGIKATSGLDVEAARRETDPRLGLQFCVVRGYGSA